jgi:hypothetical protein
VKPRRVTEITLETDEIFTIRQSAGSKLIHCPQCDSASVMVTPEQAAILFRVGLRDLCREIEAGRLHFQESPSGLLLICLDSLRNSALLGSANSNLQINQTPKNQIPTSPIKENPS